MSVNLKEWFKEASATDINTYITDLVAQWKARSLSKEDVLKTAESIAEYRNDPSLMLEVEQRFG